MYEVFRVGAAALLRSGCRLGERDFDLDLNANVDFDFDKLREDNNDGNDESASNSFNSVTEHNVLLGLRSQGFRAFLYTLSRVERSQKKTVFQLLNPELTMYSSVQSLHGPNLPCPALSRDGKFARWMWSRKMYDSVDVDKTKVQEAFEKLGLATEARHGLFVTTVEKRARENELNPGVLLNGLSHSNVKTMRKRNGWPTTLPRPLVEILFRETGIDVTPEQNLAAFHELEFDIRLEIPVTTANSEPDEPDRYSLDGMTFEIAEAHAEVDDGEALTDVRIGFDKTRLTIRADDLKPTGNYFACETPEEPGAGFEPDYTGWFKVKFMGVEPLNWLMTPITEGKVLNGRVDVKRKMAEISARTGAALVAELTVRRDAMKVRIVSEDSGASERNVTETHRKRMCEVATRRSIGRNVSEFLIHREPLSVKPA